MNERERRWIRVGMFSLELAVIGLRMWSRRGKLRPQSDYEPSIITVQGEHRISVAPDRALVQIGVQTKADSAHEANQQCAELMATVLAALRAHGIAEKAMQTNHFSLDAEYRQQPDGTPIVAGYRATNQLSVLITALDTVGQVLDAAISAGGDGIRIHHIQFSVSNAHTLQERARIAALADARRQAQAIAQEMGLVLGQPTHLQPAEITGMPPQPRMMAMRSAATPQIETGELEIAAAINVVFEATNNAVRVR